MCQERGGALQPQKDGEFRVGIMLDKQERLYLFEELSNEKFNGQGNAVGEI